MREIESKINLEDLGRYLEERGYKTSKLYFSKSHVLGEISYENEKQFFKMVLSEKFNDGLENEKRWCNLVNGPWKKYVSSFKSPKILDEGNYQSLNWFVREFVFGKTLELKEKELEKITDILKEIMRISDLCLLPNDLKRLPKSIKDKPICNHGSFLPENILKTKSGDYYLIDGEESMILGNAETDVDSFYRYIKKHGSGVMSNKFLELIKSPENSGR